MLKKHNQTTLVKILLIVNILLGLGVTSFFVWELAVYCGFIFIGVVIASFQFVVINFLMLSNRVELTRNYAILFALLCLFSIAMPLATINAVDQASLCGYQFCLGQGVDNQDYISQFKSGYTEKQSAFCNNVTTNEIAIALVAFFYLQRGENISQNTIYSISEALSISVLGGLALVSIVTFILFAVFIFKHRHQKGQRLLH